MRMSRRESIAEERTAIDPVAAPVTNLRTASPMAVAMEARAALILDPVEVSGKRLYSGLK